MVSLQVEKHVIILLMSQIERGGPGSKHSELPTGWWLTTYLQIPQWGRDLIGEGGRKPYRGSLSEFFYSKESRPYFAKIVLGEDQFQTTISCFRNNEPGRELFRLLFVNYETFQKVVIDLTPERFEIRRIEEFGGREPKEVLVFGFDIYRRLSPRGLRDKVLGRGITPDFSLKERTEIAGSTLNLILEQLDPRLSPEPKFKMEPIRLEPNLLAAREVLEIIRENLEVFPQEVRA